MNHRLGNNNINLLKDQMIRQNRSMKKNDVDKKIEELTNRDINEQYNDLIEFFHIDNIGNEQVDEIQNDNDIELNNNLKGIVKDEVIKITKRLQTKF